MSSPILRSDTSHGWSPNPRYPRASIEHPNPPSHVVPCKPAPCPPGFRMATAPITPRASQALAPPREAGPPEAPPTHVRARAPCASWDWPHRRPVVPAWVRTERVESEPNLSWAVLGEAVACRGRRQIRGEPVGASSFRPRGPRAVIGSHARSKLGSASPPRGQREQRLLGTGGLLRAARDPGTRGHPGDLLSRHRPLPSMDWRTG